MGTNNTILGGNNNVIRENCDHCTIINGASNTINAGLTNTHIIGDNIIATNSNTFHVGCSNGLYCDGDIIAYSSSDERLKDDIVPISGCLDKVLSLDAIEFDWNDKQQTYTGHDIGLIAQQVQKIAPEIVTEREDGYLAMKYEKMIPLLVGATQEQNAQLDELEKQLKKLLDESTD